MAGDIWPVVHKERAALAAEVAGLTPEQWAARSLCDRWTVYQTFGHIVGTATMSPGKFIVRMIGSGFSFNRMLDKGIDVATREGPEATLAEFRAHLNDTTSPPGPKLTWLGEIIVHGEDIRRPLGIRHNYDLDDVRRVADFYKGSNAIIGAKRRIDGLRLQATDTDWMTGDGAAVSGPILSLVMAMTGRSAGLEDLTGDGVATLRSRLST